MPRSEKESTDLFLWLGYLNDSSDESLYSVSVSLTLPLLVNVPAYARRKIRPHYS